MIFNDGTECRAETLQDAFQRRNIEICVYPNLHDKRKLTEGFDISREGYVYEKRVDLIENDHERFGVFMENLIKRYNVSYIGGCCGCTPSGIQKLYEKFVK